MGVANLFQAAATLLKTVLPKRKKRLKLKRKLEIIRTARRIEAWRNEVKHRLGKPIVDLPVGFENRPDGRLWLFALECPQRVFTTRTVLQMLEGVTFDESTGSVTITSQKGQATYRIIGKEDIIGTWLALERVDAD